MESLQHIPSLFNYTIVFITKFNESNKQNSDQFPFVILEKKEKKYIKYSLIKKEKLLKSRRNF